MSYQEVNFGWMVSTGDVGLAFKDLPLSLGRILSVVEQQPSGPQSGRLVSGFWCLLFPLSWTLNEKAKMGACACELMRGRKQDWLD